MATLTAADRKKMPAKEFAGPGRSFPENDPTHDREAISGATRSYNAGNISKSEEERIQASARRKLGSSPMRKREGRVPAKQEAPAKAAGSPMAWRGR